MGKQYLVQKKSSVVIYALVIVVILGAGLIAFQDIKVPSEHVSQNIEVSLNK